MGKTWLTRLVVAVLVATAILSAPLLFRLRAFNALPQSNLSIENLQTVGTPLGEYKGSVKLEGVYTGTHSDTDKTPVAKDLGYIELALNLSSVGNNVQGFVMLDNTLVFTKEHTIMVTPVAPPPEQGTPTPEPFPLDIGPKVNGIFDGATMSLTSDKFSMMLSEGRTLDDGRNLPERKITRQFSLKTTEVQNGGVTLIGEYRETIWGYSPFPSTVVGTFQLQRPDFSSTSINEPNTSIYLPLIKRE